MIALRRGVVSFVCLIACASWLNCGGGTPNTGERGSTGSNAPSIASITPTSGPIAGGTTVTINGAGFLSGMDVGFGGIQGSSVVFVSPTLATAVSPPHAAGAVDIQVVNPDKGAGTLAGAFLYLAPPSITSVAPTNGTTSGGTAVTVTGTGFQPGATVLMGGVAATGVVVTSSTQITLNSPPHAAGVVNVQVTNTDSQSTTAMGAFTYNPIPTVVSISPNSGSTAGGTVVTVTGSSFQAGATVTIGGSSASSISITSATQLTATTPAHSPGAFDVVVTNPDLQSNKLTGGFTFVAPPVISSISPASGPTAGSTSITINGSGFQSGVTVKFGGTLGSSVSVVSAAQITVVTPAHAAGVVDIVVTNPDLQAATVTSAFTFIPPPTVTSVVPNAGALAGGTTVTLTGTNFNSGATVKFGGASASSVSLASPTSMTMSTPANAAGAVNIVVTNPDGQIGTLTSGYTYNPAPVIQYLSPTNGSVAGGTAVTITGSNFLAGATVTIGGQTAVVTALSSTSISVTTPAHLSGSTDLVVTNSDSQSATAIAGFTFIGPPVVSAISPDSGLNTGNQTVVLSGSNLQAGATITFGGATVTIVSSDPLGASVTVTTPAHAVGPVDVVVTNPDMQSSTTKNGFRYGTLLFQDGFESGSLPGNWDHCYGCTLVTDGDVIEGSSALRIHYFLDGTSFASNDLWVEKDFPALSRFHIRGYAKIESTGSPSAGNMQRKLYYLKSPPMVSDPNGQDHAWAVVLTSDANALRVSLSCHVSQCGYGTVIPSCSTTTIGNCGAGIDQLYPGYTLAYDRWYSLEMEVQANTAGVANGIVRLWVTDDTGNTQLLVDRNNLYINGTLDGSVGYGGVTRFEIGHQVSADRLATDEYRRWDKIGIADAFIGK